MCLCFLLECLEADTEKKSNNAACFFLCVIPDNGYPREFLQEMIW